MGGEGYEAPIEAPAFVRGSERLTQAFAVAADAHAGQSTAGDRGPYLRHPVEVAGLLYDVGVAESVIAAAVLHDAVEDSELTVSDVGERFGWRVATLVQALTEDAAIEDWIARKEALREQVREAGPDAAAIYAADKLANLRDMRRLYAEHGEEAIRLHKAPTFDARVEAWRADAAMAAEVSPGLEFLGELRSTLQEFERERRARTAVRHA
jgi:guanosine-3',5'-bis(diphosphate) 3'-pyrophosphohydrolase